MELKAESTYSNVDNIPQRLQEAPQERIVANGKKQSLKTGLLVVCLVLIIALASATIASFVKTKNLEEQFFKLNNVLSNQNESNTKIKLSIVQQKENENKSNILELRLQVLENQTKINIQKLKEKDDKVTLHPRSCNDIRSSVDTIAYLSPFKRSETSLQALCDLQTDGGGWLVWQRRMDGSEEFYRGWDDYVKGFGNLTGEFWLGLDTLHKLTSNGKYELRIDMEDFNKKTAYAKYNSSGVKPIKSY